MLWENNLNRKKYGKNIVHIKVTGRSLDSGHFISEEKPLDTIKELTNFFLSK